MIAVQSAGDRDWLRQVIEECDYFRVRLRIVPVQGSALGALYLEGKPLSLDRPRGQEAAWLHELGLEARAALVESETPHRAASEDADGAK